MGEGIAGKITNNTIDSKTPSKQYINYLEFIPAMCKEHNKTLTDLEQCAVFTEMCLFLCSLV